MVSSSAQPLAGHSVIAGHYVTGSHSCDHSGGHARRCASADD